MVEKTFSKLLKQHIKDSGYTNYETARAAEINRVNLQRYISGERVPPLHAFEALLDVVPMSAEEQRELREAYELAADGEDAYYLRRCIREILENAVDLSGTSWPENAVEYDEDSEDESRDPIQLIKGALAVERFICDRFREEMAAEHGPDRHVLLYLPVNHFSECIFHAYTVSGIPTLPDLKITQLIPLSKRADRVEDQFYNLRVLKNLIPRCFYLSRSYEACYYYQKNTEGAGYGAIYPYYGIFKNSVVLFSGNMEQAVWIRNQEIVKEYRKQFLTAYGRSDVVKPLITYFEDSFTRFHFLTEQDEVQEEEIKQYAVGYHPCFTLMLAGNLFTSAMCPENSERTKVLLGRGNGEIEKSAHFLHYFTKAGLEEFASTGELAEYPESGVRPLTIKERIHVLDNIIEISAQENIEIGLIRNEHLDIKLPVNIFLGSTSGLILTLNNKKQRPRHIQISEPSICHAFWKFIDSMAKWQDVLSADETRKILAETRKRLKDRLNEN